MTRPANGADLAVLGFSTYLRLTTFRRDGRPMRPPCGRWPTAPTSAGMTNICW